MKREYSDISTIKPIILNPHLKTPSITSERSIHAPSPDPELTSTPGLRAAEAYVRPSHIYAVGNLISSGFDLRSTVFSFRLQASTPCTEDVPTEIFLPDFHFPRDQCTVEMSGGKWSISNEDYGPGDGDGATVQILRWWHKEGEQWIRVTGVKRASSLTRYGEEEGYLDQCQQNKCAVM
jgi:hypothetical protein